MKSFQIAQAAFQTAASLLSSTRFQWLRPVLRLWLFQNGVSDRRRPRKGRCPVAMTQMARANCQNAGAPGKRLCISTSPGSCLPPWSGHRCYLQGGPSTLQHNAASSGQKLEAAAHLGLCVWDTVRKFCTNNGGIDERCTVNSSERTERACYLLHRSAKKRTLPRVALLQTECCQTCENDQAMD